MSESAWKIHDKTWMKVRQERWKEINCQLKKILRYDWLYKADMPFHKAYFLKGKGRSIDEKWTDIHYDGNLARHGVDPDIIGKPFYLSAYFKVWYYPGIDEALFQQWCGAAKITDKYSWWRGAFGVDESAEYFSDRSIYIDRYLAPKTSAELYEVIKQSCPNAGEESWQGEHQKAIKLHLQKIMRALTRYQESQSTYRNDKIVTTTFVMCFAFPLLKDLLAPYENLSAVIGVSVGYSTRRGGNYRDDIILKDKLEEIMHCLLTYDIPPQSFAEGQATKLFRELTAFFDAGINPAIDALWSEMKTKQSA